MASNRNSIGLPSCVRVYTSTVPPGRPRGYYLEYKWDRRFLSFCSIEHDVQKESEIVATLPPPPKHSSESIALIK